MKTNQPYFLPSEGIKQPINFFCKRSSFLLLILLITTSNIFAQQGIEDYIHGINMDLRKTFENLASPNYSNKQYHMSVHQVDESRFVSFGDSIEFS